MTTNTSMSVYNKHTDEEKNVVFKKHLIDNVFWDDSKGINRNLGYENADDVNVFIPKNQNDMSGYVEPKKYKGLNNTWTLENGDTQLFLANTCFRRMHKYVPWETGTLASHATVRPGSVTYEEPYAHKQYTTNKGKGIRGKHWDKKMKSAEKELIVKEVEAYAKKMKGSK